MARDQGTFKLQNPWLKIGWGILASTIVLAAVLGFGVLSRFQQNAPTLSLWSAICRGIGISADIGPATALLTPTRIAWTSQTLDQIESGNPEHGAFVGLNCTACHGERGVSASTLIPTLAGMNPAVIYKQLDDYRMGKRPWGVMSAIDKALSVQDSADVAAYFAIQGGGLPPVGAIRIPESGRTLREADPATRLIYAGAPQRGIPPCSACHGPGGYKLGAPSLHGQHAAYIERQLGAFAQGFRQNDIFSQMRSIARQLTPDRMGPAAPTTTYTMLPKRIEVPCGTAQE